MFTKRHEQELAEIKATTHQLVGRFEEILEQLERIKQNQDKLAAAQGPAAPESGAPSRGPKSERRRRASASALSKEEEEEGGGRPPQGTDRRPATSGRTQATPAGREFAPDRGVASSLRMKTIGWIDPRGGEVRRG